MAPHLVQAEYLPIGIAEDAPHTNGEAIAKMGCRRNDTRATSAGLDGDWATVDCTGGALWTMPVFITPLGDAMTDDTNDAIRVTGVTVQAVSGNAAHDAADSQYPVVLGGHATASVAGETAVATGDVVRWYFGTDGIPIVRSRCSLEDVITPVPTSSITDTTSTQAVAAQAAGVKVIVNWISILNTSGTATGVKILDGNGGTNRATIPIGANGATMAFDPPLTGFTAATRVDVQATTGVSGLIVTVGACKSKI